MCESQRVVVFSVTVNIAKHLENLDAHLWLKCVSCIWFTHKSFSYSWRNLLFYCFITPTYFLILILSLIPTQNYKEPRRMNEYRNLRFYLNKIPLVPDGKWVFAIVKVAYIFFFFTEGVLKCRKRWFGLFNTLALLYMYCAVNFIYECL